MKLVCTYCSGPKRDDGGLLPAVDRYLSGRIRALHAAAREQGALFRILSGEFGLIPPDRPIPWYDHLLRPEEAAGLAVRIADELVALGVVSVRYHTADPRKHPDTIPYLNVMEKACGQAGLEVEVILLEGNPD